MLEHSYIYKIVLNLHRFTLSINYNSRHVILHICIVVINYIYFNFLYTHTYYSRNRGDCVGCAQVSCCNTLTAIYKLGTY